MAIVEKQYSDEVVAAEPIGETKEERRARRKAFAKKCAVKSATFLGVAAWKITKGLWNYIVLVTALNQAAEDQE